MASASGLDSAVVQQVKSAIEAFGRAFDTALDAVSGMVDGILRSSGTAKSAYVDPKAREHRRRAKAVRLAQAGRDDLRWRGAGALVSGSDGEEPFILGIYRKFFPDDPLRFFVSEAPARAVKRHHRTAAPKPVEAYLEIKDGDRILLLPRDTTSGVDELGQDPKPKITVYGGIDTKKVAAARYLDARKAGKYEMAPLFSVDEFLRRHDSELLSAVVDGVEDAIAKPGERFGPDGSQGREVLLMDGRKLVLDDGEYLRRMIRP
jgi:hypothetical protein